jgi:Flp pilus assembly CpaE family ATPase
MELARTYEDGLTQTKAAVLRAVAGLSDEALIVVDAPQPFAASIRPFVSRAVKVVVITESSLLGVAVAHAVLAAMERFGIPASRIAVVQTDVRGKSDLSRAELEAALRISLSAELPNERDRRFESRLDVLVSLLAAAPIGDFAMISEKPMFDLRSET